MNGGFTGTVPPPGSMYVRAVSDASRPPARIVQELTADSSMITMPTTVRV